MRNGAAITCFRVALAWIALGAAIGCAPARMPPVPITEPEPTIADRVAQYGPAARARLLPYFAAAGIPYPPQRFVLLGLKRERELQVYAAGPGQALAFIRAYPVFGASGGLGPKLREGDRQVPEGVYRIWYLNPNSVAHLSLGLDYPNSFDRIHAEEEGRPYDTLGGEIMIHGGAGSIGCLAVGDEAAEDLFVLAAESDWERARVIVSPVDFRINGLPEEYEQIPEWVIRLHDWLRAELQRLPPPPAVARDHEAVL